MPPGAPVLAAIVAAAGAAVEALVPRVHPPGEFWRYLDCAGHEAWSSFRTRLPAFRAAGFPPRWVGLVREADFLIVQHGPQVDLRRFVVSMTDPTAELDPRDCMYGFVAALFVRGLAFMAEGFLDAAREDWRFAIRNLGGELSLDFMESTGWAIRSADILLALPVLRRLEQRGGVLGAVRSAVAAIRPAERRRPRAAASTMLRPRALGEGPWAVDPLCAGWRPAGGPPRRWPAPEHRARPIRAVVYGYHAALFEPVSSIMLAEESEVRLDLVWYGVSPGSPEMCAYFSAICRAETFRPGLVRGKWVAYESNNSIADVEARYRRFWAEQQSAGETADLFFCLEMRDAYFFLRVAQVPVIWFAAVIYMQDEALSDYGAREYLRQFDEFRSHDVLAGGSAQPPTAAVAQSLFLAQSIAYHTKVHIPAVRPLSLYVGARYAPNATAGGGLTRLLVICARTRLMMSVFCHRVFSEGGRSLPKPARVRLHLPWGTRSLVHGMTFEEVSRFSAVVLVPWNIALTTFWDYYEMNMPMFVPDSLWVARLWSKQVTSYSRAHPNIHRELRRPPNATRSFRHPTPYPSSLDLQATFGDAWWWAEHYEQMRAMPGVRTFASVPELLGLLWRGADLRAASAAMAAEAARARAEVVPFWAGLAARLAGAD